jgi:hypothetical protein
MTLDTLRDTVGKLIFLDVLTHIGSKKVAWRDVWLHKGQDYGAFEGLSPIINGLPTVSLRKPWTGWATRLQSGCKIGRCEIVGLHRKGK